MDKISDLKQIIIKTLDANKAQDIVSIDLKDKSSMADFMIIASGTSSRHIQSLSEQVLEKLKKLSGHSQLVRMQGSASLALEIMIVNFLYGKVLLIDTGFYSQRLYSIINSAVKHCIGIYQVSPILDFDKDPSMDISYSQIKTNPKKPSIEVDSDYNPFQIFNDDRVEIF